MQEEVSRRWMRRQKDSRERSGLGIKDLSGTSRRRDDRVAGAGNSKPHALLSNFEALAEHQYDISSQWRRLDSFYSRSAEYRLMSY